MTTRVVGCTPTKRWIVCQVGAREHYALARALHRKNLLEELVTDAWVPRSSSFKWLPGEIGVRLRGRFDDELATATVSHFTSSMVRSELRSIFQRRYHGWNQMIRRNDWFQEEATRHLRGKALRDRQSGPPIVFAYAYAARKILQAAREAGATTILGQIDGGPIEERLVASIWSKYANIAQQPPQAPDRYWKAWREECDLADRIVVNSSWSRDLLVEANIDPKKVCIVPVIYDYRSNDAGRQYPLSFDRSRPLRALFLGNLTIRKGVLEVLQAAERLHDEPIEFWFVGPDPNNLRARAKSLPNVKWYGPVPRSEVEGFYNKADVFLFPTHSDGFGMTQLEAQNRGLPVIASRHCGTVVEHGTNGLILERVAAPAVARALQYFMQHPQELSRMSCGNASTRLRFTSTEVLPILLECAMTSSTVRSTPRGRLSS